MSDVDELRDRLSVAVEQELERWMNDLSDERREGDAVADRIIDEFGMTNEWSFRFEGKDRRYSLNRAEDLRTIGLYGPLEDAAIESRVVGEWEKHD